MACELCWSITPEPQEEGMDARVIDCLSDAFCAYGAIAFVSDLPQSGGRFIDRAKGLFRSSQPVVQTGGYSFRRLRMPRVRSRALWLVDTERADIARRFFLQQAWHYAPCQIAFLREAGGYPVALADVDIQAAILDGGWQALTTALHASSSVAVCTPGHDGGWLKFVFSDAHAMRRFDEILEICCTALQMPYTSAL
jgi:hypothetical protein